MRKLDYSLIGNVQVENINHKDAPDYVDAFIASGSYDGREMTDDELDELNQDSDYLYEAIINQIN